MSKVTLNNVGSLIDATTAANSINANFGTIETAFDNTLSRNGASPNQMLSSLDMNSNAILNLPLAITAHEPVRLVELQNAILGDFSGVLVQLSDNNTWTGVNVFNNTVNIFETLVDTLPAQTGTFLGYAPNRIKVQNNSTYSQSLFALHVELDTTLAGSGPGNAAGFFHTVSGAASNTNGFTIGSTHYVSAEANWAGGTLGSPQGAVYGLSVYALMGGPTELHLANITGMEINPQARGVGASHVAYKSGIQIANLANDRLQGTLYDGALSISAIFDPNGLAPGWKNGILFSDGNGQHPISTTGGLIRTQGSSTVAYGVDISTYTITTSAFKSNGFAVNGSGDITAKTGAFTSAINSGLSITDGTSTAVFYPSSNFTNSVSVGASSNHPLIFIQNNSIAGYIDTSKQFNIGSNGTTQGLINVRGLTSGAVSIGVQAAAGTYNFNLPITAGTSGQVLTSAGGVGAAMTWSSAIIGTITLSGDVTGSGTNAITTVLATAQPAVHTWALSQTFSSAMVYGGVTLANSVTGTGSMVLASSPALTGSPTSSTAAVDTNTTQIATTAFVLAQAASANPLINGSVAVGTSTRYARADHVHPVDTSRAPLASPTFTGTVVIPTPFTLGAISVTSTGTQLNYLAAATGTTGTTSTNVVFSTAPTISQPVINGITAGTSAAAGVVGEVLTANAALDSLSVTTNTASNITSVSLTAGDWDVWGSVYYFPAAATSVSYLESTISTTSATRNLVMGAWSPNIYPSFVPGGASRQIVMTPVLPVTISSTTTYYLTNYATFGVSTMAAGGIIYARRRR